MSHEASYTYKLEKAIKQHIQAARVANTTRDYLANFRQMLQAFEEQNFDNFIPAAMDRLRSDIGRIESLLEVDPFSAREISMGIQGFIYNMRGEANTVRREQQEAERERRRLEEEERRAQKTEAMNAYYEGVKQVKNAAVQNAARGDFAILREKIVSGDVANRAMVEAELESILKSAVRNATEAKKKAEEQAKREGIEAQIAEAKKRVEQSDINAAESQKIIKSLDEVLGRNKNAEAPVEEIQQALNQIDNQVLQQRVTEDELMEATRKVCSLLRLQGFAIHEGGIKRDDVDGEKRILICAMQSNGHKALCMLSDKGTLRRSFNGYEGSGCLKDMKNFNDELQRAYSIALSDKRVLWKNPDKISKGEKPVGNANNKWSNR